jgi:DNA damage-inducible protein 1
MLHSFSTFLDSIANRKPVKKWTYCPMPVIYVRPNTAPNPDDVLELELPDNAQIDLVIGMVASLTNHPPELITITDDSDNILSPETFVSSLDLGRIVFFKAVLTTTNDSVMLDSQMAARQAQILERIRRQNIEENERYAYENAPESFVPFSLLFVSCSVNNVPIKAMLDTGAQISILPFSMATRLGVAHLIDERWNGLTMGVGTQRPRGRIHALQVNVGGLVIANPFSVLEGPLDTCILGVDWLMKNRAVINLASRTLRIGRVEVPLEEQHGGGS